MRATPEHVLRRVRAVIGTAGNEHANAAVAKLVLHRILFDGDPMPDWRTAACADVDPDTFYPAPRDQHGTAAAKRICASCPVRANCLADTLRWEAAGRRYGVIGGLTASERDRLMTARRRQQAGEVAA